MDITIIFGMLIRMMNTMDHDSPPLVLSRHRQEIPEDAEIAAFLAETFNAVVLSIPFLYDLPSEHPIIQRLRSLPKPPSFFVPLAPRSVKSLLNDLRIPFSEVFAVKESVQIPDGGVLGGHVERLEDSLPSRWYPVIDNSRCAACLECVNYCLFGVYSIGSDSRPFVDQPDACRDGCPACARVCPGKAIMFPLYEDQVIAGYEQDSADQLDGLIDLVEHI